MPQLDTVYTFLIFSWTWTLLSLISQKIKTFYITKGPTNSHRKTPNKPMPTLPWT